MPIELDPEYWSGCWSHGREIKGAILAAGLGKRMDPLTARHLPKPLFPLGGKTPMTELWVRRMVESGITDVSMNLCVLKETIRRHFRDGAKFGCEITYVEENVPSGTLGGTCKQVLGSRARRVHPENDPVPFEPFRGSTVIVASGDIVTNFGADLLEEMHDIHAREGAALTMALSPVAWERRKDFGTVVLDSPRPLPGILSKSGRITEFREKDPSSPSNLNNASIYMIERELLERLDALRTPASLDVGEPFYDFGKHVFPAMLGKLPYVSLPSDHLLWGIQYDGRWFDVGRKRDYLRVNEHVLDGEVHVDLPYEKLPWGFLGNNVEIDFSKVKIVPPVVIGNDCVVEPGVTLGPYAILGDGWVVERGAVIRHSVFWESGHGGLEIERHEVRRGVTVEESIVVGGVVESDVREKTVDVDEAGSLRVLPIDSIPTGSRA